MAIKASEISDLIKQRIENFEATAEARNVGTIISRDRRHLRIHGLADVQYGEMIEFPGNTFGLALNLEQDSVGAVVLGDYKHSARRRHRQDHGPHPRSAGRPRAARPRRRRARRSRSTARARSSHEDRSPIESVAPGVIYRKSVSQPVQTGYKAVDSMVPIGRGQRELIIGDRQTGKTALAIDTIINQKGSGIKCIYVAIGQKQSTDRQRGAQARRARRAGRTRSSSPPRPRLRRDAVHRAVLGLRDGRVLHGQRRRRADHLRRPVQAGRGRIARSRCCCAARRAARRIPATCSICTRACSSAPRA